MIYLNSTIPSELVVPLPSSHIGYLCMFSNIVPYHDVSFCTVVGVIVKIRFFIEKSRTYLFEIVENFLYIPNNVAVTLID